MDFRKEKVLFMDLKKEIKLLSDEVTAQYGQIKKIEVLADDIHKDCMRYTDNNIETVSLNWTSSVIKFNIMQDYITQTKSELRTLSQKLDKLCEELRKVEV